MKICATTAKSQRIDYRYRLVQCIEIQVLSIVCKNHKITIVRFGQYRRK
jgi:hypothetical protein